MRRLVFAAYGVTCELLVEQDELFDWVCEVLPPGWEEGDPEAVQARVALTGGGDVLVDDVPVASTRAAWHAIGVVDATIRARISLLAPAHIFVHAGVVAHAGRAIVMPGNSMSGKSRLVAALLRAGAAYCSDEYAVLDAQGQVHPYPKPLSVRVYRRFQKDVPAEDFGAPVASGPLQVGLIVMTSYEEGAGWNPDRGSAAEAALALLEHTIPVRSRPGEAMAAVQRAAAGAIVLKGPRGDAAPVATSLLAVLDPA